MLRATAISLLILISVAVMLPLVDSSAHNNGSPTVSRRSHMRRRHSRAWWRRYHARLRRQRAALRLKQAERGQNMNVAADSHNSNHAVSGNMMTARGASGAAALSLPQGWVRRTVGGETKYVLSDANGQSLGAATLSLVNPNATGETVMTGRGNRKLLGGVPLVELRRTVIDKMVASGGWVVNDMTREINGHPVFIVLAQTGASSDGRTPLLNWTFFFTEVDGRIYSVASSSLVESSNRVSDDSAQLVSSFLNNSRSTSTAASQR